MLGTLPLLFALHQVDEAIVWWGLRGQVSQPITHAAVVVFLAFAFLLPFLVPLALFDIEPGRCRRRWMGMLLGVGGITSALLLIPVITGSVGATIDGIHIAYVASVSYPTVLGIAYVVVICGALVLSSNHALEWFGVANLAVAIGLAWLTFTGLTSLWCAWAAATSLVIALYLRRRPLPSQRAYA